MSRTMKRMRLRTRVHGRPVFRGEQLCLGLLHGIAGLVKRRNRSFLRHSVREFPRGVQQFALVGMHSFATGQGHFSLFGGEKS